MNLMDKLLAHPAVAALKADTSNGDDDSLIAELGGELISMRDAWLAIPTDVKWKSFFDEEYKIPDVVYDWPEEQIATGASENGYCLLTKIALPDGRSGYRFAAGGSSGQSALSSYILPEDMANLFEKY